MAYDRVNWQNQPSTATPINADNLNKMDKGINDLEEGKVSKTDLVQTDTINDPNKVASSAVTHALGQEIDTLNNKLANKVTGIKLIVDEEIPIELSERNTYFLSVNGTSNVYTAFYIIVQSSSVRSPVLIPIKTIDTVIVTTEVSSILVKSTEFPLSCYLWSMKLH